MHSNKHTHARLSTHTVTHSHTHARARTHTHTHTHTANHAVIPYAREIYEPNLYTPDVPDIVRTTKELDPVPVGVTSET